MERETCYKEKKKEESEEEEGLKDSSWTSRREDKKTKEKEREMGQKCNKICTDNPLRPQQ